MLTLNKSINVHELFSKLYIGNMVHSTMKEFMYFCCFHNPAYSVIEGFSSLTHLVHTLFEFLKIPGFVYICILRIFFLNINLI